MHDGVALHERAAARVLARQAHRGALEQQRPEREKLAVPPVDVALAGHPLTLGQQRHELGVDGEPLGRLRVRRADPLEDRTLDGCLPADHRSGALELRCGTLKSGDGFGQRRRRVAALAGLGEDPLELCLVVAQDVLGLGEREITAPDQRLGVELAHRALRGDQVVHEGLRHRRVVALVVAAAPVADHVDDRVAVELLAELERELCDPHARLGVVPIDVEDRHLQALGDVRRIERGARRDRARRETDLVVDDHVDRAAGTVAAQLGEVERLDHDTLAREGRVAVDEDRQHREAVTAEVDLVLLGAHDALEHRVDRLEVRGVCREVHLRGRARLRDELSFGAQVVLHVT